MRLFCGIDLPPDILLRVDALLSMLRPLASVKWSPLENLHVTTKFIGEWPEEKLTELTSALESLVAREPFTIHLHGLGWFPADRPPRVLWAGVDGGRPLGELARATNEALTKLGIAAEERPYSPHLTLARLPQPAARDLHVKVESLRQISLGAYDAVGFYLYRSQPGRSGHSVYQKLNGYAFQQ